MEPIRAAIALVLPWWQPVFFAACFASAALCVWLLRSDPGSWREDDHRKREAELRRLRQAAIERAIEAHRVHRRHRPRRSTRGREP